MALVCRARELPSLARSPGLARRYPRVAAYLDGLPAAFDSYPECQARSSVGAELVAAGSRAPFAPDVPEEVRWLLTVPHGMWMPEVRLAAAILALADDAGRSDDDHAAWMKARNAALFKSLVYRSVMAFMSPAALVDKAASRWESFHRGSALTVERRGDGEALSRLTFPPQLFSGPLPRFYAAALQAGLEHCRARTVALTVEDVAPTWVVYRARWS